MSSQQEPTWRPKALLFDLDGTLLRVQMGEFIPRYIAGLAACCAQRAKPAAFERAMLGAIRGLIRFDGTGELTNEQRIYRHLQQSLGLEKDFLRDCFARFRTEGLETLAGMVHPIPLARQVLRECLGFSVPIVLATNPVFPSFMIEARLNWGGLGEIDFARTTSFENSCYCKPHPGYFHEVAQAIAVAPEDCLMVGNDTSHDLAAAAVGMRTFLVDTWLVEREDDNWPAPQRGDHRALQLYLQSAFA